MKRFLQFTLSLSILIFWSSCRKDFEFEPSNGTLKFSKDTVYLDTVFTNIGSSTYNLKVYNHSDNDIIIPSIKLTEGQSSMYRLNVDGMTGVGPVQGKAFENVELLAKDSMYIFIETTINIQDLVLNQTQFLYTDAIEFDAGDNLQKVELVTLVKDAVFIYPDKDANDVIETLTFDVDGDGIDDETTIKGRFLEDSELTFTNEKPYVIYGYAAVDEGKTLTIEAGARVHFHANSGILVTNNASLKVNGLPSTDPDLMEGEVIFEGDRLEPGFSEVPGQWEAIWLFNGSTDNDINYATIKNATAGIVTDGNMDDTEKLNITNTQIYNSSNYGILARGSNINAENLVINNSGQSSFAGLLGGRYNITHATIANYWNNSFRQFPSLLLTNYVVNAENESVVNPLEEANFTNCIIYGNNDPEFILDREAGADFKVFFENCLVKFDTSNSNFTGDLYTFSNTDIYKNTIFNQDPDFLDPDNNKLQIPNGSAADGKAIIFGNLTSDISGALRGNPADIGAYESIVFDDED